MTDEVGLLVETLAAHFTLIRAFVGVRKDVIAQVAWKTQVDVIK